MFAHERKIKDDDTFENFDLFHRVEIAEGLENVCEATKNSMVIALNGPWGVGKTTFLKLWKNKLSSSGKNCIYFNAFEKDFLPDAYLCLCSEILKAYDDFGIKSERRKNAFRDKAIRLGKSLAGSSLRVGTRVLTQGLVDLESTGRLADEALGELEGKTLQAIDTALEETMCQEANIKNFRQSLSEIPVSIAKKMDRTIFLQCILSSMNWIDADPTSLWKSWRPRSTSLTPIMCTLSLG